MRRLVLLVTWALVAIVIACGETLPAAGDLDGKTDGGADGAVPAPDSGDGAGGDGDGATSPDATVDAGLGPCTPAMPFTDGGAASFWTLSGPQSVRVAQGTYFSAAPSPDAGIDLFAHERLTGGGLGSPQSVFAALNTSANETAPALTEDGKLVVFEREDSLHGAERVNATAEFPAAAELFQKAHAPYFAGTGANEVLYFAEDTGAELRIVEFPRVGLDTGMRTLVALESVPGADDDSPVVAANGLEIFFFSTRNNTLLGGVPSVVLRWMR